MIVEKNIKTINNKIKELAAIYNTFGYDDFISKYAEEELVSNNSKHINQAKDLASIARYMP